ncbi:MAG TPA: caspase family protein, partial [Saprospiraceae bacterium]|nr:caspase family protein [Saprospiraceae bacterium]
MALFALLIGINEYHPASQVRPLRGCHNDVLAVHQFLYAHCRHQFADDTHLRVLLDAQADRAGVLAAFRDHLGRAAAGDTALVYYCGHGSYGVTAPEFQAFTADQQEEGWVLYDSRCAGGYDLADKEIAVLLERLAARGASVVVIADSCHSGSVTRSQEVLEGWQGRFISGTKEARPLPSYLDGEYLRRREKTGLLSIPDSPHYLLSACDKTEVAWESDDRRGVFTKALIAALQRSGGSLSYDDLYAQVRASVRQLGQQQSPRAEAFGGFDPQTGFLGQAIGRGRRRYALHSQPGTAGQPPAWMLDAGAAHGLSSDLNTALPVQVYEQPQGGSPLGQAWILDLGATHSTLSVSDLTLDSGKTYWAAVEGAQATAFAVYCPDRSGLGGLEMLLRERPESPLRLSDDPSGCAFSLHSDGVALRLHEHSTSGAGALLHGVEGHDGASAAYMLSVLERLARWHRLLRLQNARTMLPDWGVRLHLQARYGPDWEAHEPAAGTDTVHLPFRGQRIGLRLLADNRSGQPLYLALLYLSPRYGSKVWWSSTSAVPDGHQGLSLLQDNFYLPEGVDEEMDHFRLIASTEPIEPTAFPAQPDLPRAVVPPPADAGGPTRSIGGFSQPDWSVRPLSLRIVRERAGQVLGEQPVTLAGGQVRIGAHPVFRATYTLAGARTNSRGESVWSPNSPYFQDNPYFRPLPLADTRSGELQPIFLDIADTVQEQHLEEVPLVISIKNDPEERELTLPFWFDGVNCLPAGEWVLSDGGDLEVHVRRLPEPDPDAPTRSVGKAFKLFFFKMAKGMGFKVNTQYLRWVEY